ncbi:MAG: YbbR-like domain-containing protein, partial [Candidatus Omnitrophota bacterium]
KRQALEEVLERYNFMLKEVPVRVVFSGNAPEGYRVVYEKVQVNPSSIAIYGPEELIGKVEELKTDVVNIGEYTRSTQLRLGISADIKPLEFKEKFVEVYIPIEKAGDK